MPISHIEHYNLRAERGMLDVLRDFYVTVVGLQVGRRPLSSYGYWLYANGHALLHLSEARPGDPREPHVRGTFDHVAFACTDMPAFEAHLRVHGIAFRHGEVSAAGQRQLFFSDPAGNGIELNFAANTPESVPS